MTDLTDARREPWLPRHRCPGQCRCRAQLRV